MGTFATTTSLNTMIPGVDISTSTAASLASLCITWAETQVRGKLARRYDVSAWDSAGSVPPQITSITEMIAGGYFFKQISRGGPESIERGDQLINHGLDQLMMLADSQCDLVDSSGSLVDERADATRDSVLCNTSNYPTTFNEDSPLNWAVSSTKLSDIETNERD